MTRTKPKPPPIVAGQRYLLREVGNYPCNVMAVAEGWVMYRVGGYAIPELSSIADFRRDFVLVEGKKADSG